MRRLFLVFVVLSINICLSSQENEYYYILDKYYVSMHIIDFTKFPPQDIPLTPIEQKVSVATDGSYEGIKLSKDLYGNFIFQYLSFDSDGKILSVGQILTDGSVISLPSMGIISGYKMKVTSTDVDIICTTTVEENYNKGLTNKETSFVGFIYEKTYRIMQ